MEPLHLTSLPVITIAFVPVEVRQPCCLPGHARGGPEHSNIRLDIHKSHDTKEVRIKIAGRARRLALLQPNERVVITTAICDVRTSRHVDISNGPAEQLALNTRTPNDTPETWLSSSWRLYVAG